MADREVLPDITSLLPCPATDSPTKAPTKAPTDAPTAPTDSPTDAPTSEDINAAGSTSLSGAVLAMGFLVAACLAAM
jgi:cell division septation protein DedD